MISTNHAPIELSAEIPPQMYSNLVQRCFEHCVDDFTSAKLSSKEEGCTMRCVDKFIKGSERLGQRFQEQNAAMAQSGGLMR
jgi:import inner membrane translocase subunit TIM9